MQIDRTTGLVEGAPLLDTYVYEAPIRLWHWVTVTAVVVLAVTGYLIGSPLPSLAGEPTTLFFMGYVRMIHMSAGWIFAVAFLVRVYWAFAGNYHARGLFIVPVWSGKWWKGMLADVRYYLFLQEHSDLWLAHNPLAQFAVFTMFVLGAIVLILTGFGLFAEQWPEGVAYMKWFGWVSNVFGEPQAIRTLHHFMLWYLLLFAIVHIYMVFREDITRGSTVISTMVNGIRMFKNPPRG